MEYERLIVEQEDRIIKVTLNRPQRRNSFDAKMAFELREFLLTLQLNTEVRSLIITGAGTAFCAGADFYDLMSDQETDPIRQRKVLRALFEVTAYLRELDVVTIAAVNGTALGGGAGLAMACDIVLSSQKARFGFVFHKAGACAGDMGVSYHLPRVVGLHKASELLFTGDIIDSSEAERIGLVNRVLPHDQLMEESKKMAEKVSFFPSLSIAATKTAINKGMNLDLFSQIGYETHLQGAAFQTPEHREAIRALREKRPPRFD
jgi:enoyl-CoA hydratase/carnithine racemase